MTKSLSQDSTIALGQSSSSMEFEEYELNSRVDLITITLGTKPPALPLREERNSLGVETVFKAKGVGWQGVRKKYKSEKKKKERAEKYCLPLACPYVISWDCSTATTMMTCGDYRNVHDDNDDDADIDFNDDNSLQNNQQQESLKALTYEEYLLYLKKCQEKLKRKGEGGSEETLNEFAYLELVRTDDEEERLQQQKKQQTRRRKRIFTKHLDDARDDPNGTICSSRCTDQEELREVPSLSINSIATASYLSDDMPDRINLYNEPILVPASSPSPTSPPSPPPVSSTSVNTDTFNDQRKLVSFANQDHVKIIPGKDTINTDEKVSEQKINKGQLNMNEYNNDDNDKEEASPRSRIRIARGCNLLDQLFTCSQQSTTSTNISPLGKGAAADLARLLLKDVENIRGSFDMEKERGDSIVKHGSEVLKRHAVTTNASPPSPPQLKKNIDSIKVNSDLCEQQAQRKIESIGLAKNILNEVQASLEEEEKAISECSSFDSTNVDPAVALLSSLLKEEPQINVSPPSPQQARQTDDLIRVDSDLHKEQAQRRMESIGLAKRVLNEVQISLEEEVENISRSPSFASLEPTYSDPAVALSRSILKEVNSGKIEPVIIMKEKLRIELKSPDILEEDLDVMKITTEIKERQNDRGKASRGLAKLMLDEVHASTKDQDDQADKLRKSSIIGNEQEVVTFTKTNHPAELALRRAQDTRKRHQEELLEVAKSSSNDSEDSWSQPINNHGLEESESMSFSSIEKSASTSAEIARRLIEEATARHRKISQKSLKLANHEVSPIAETHEEHEDNGNAEHDEIDSINSSLSSLQATITTIPEEKIQECDQNEELSSNMIEEMIEESTEPIEEITAKSALYVNKKIAEAQEEIAKQSSMESSKSIMDSDSLDSDSFSSAFSDDSMDSTESSDNAALKQSTELAKRLIQNAKMRLQEVQLASPQKETELINSAEGKGECKDDFDGSAELAKRLFQEAFAQNKNMPVKKNLIAVSPPCVSEDESLEHENQNSTKSLKLARNIMADAGFSDLFSALSDDGSFEKIILDGKEEKNVLEESHSFDAERIELESIQEDGTIDQIKHTHLSKIPSSQVDYPRPSTESTVSMTSTSPTSFMKNNSISSQTSVSLSPKKETSEDCISPKTSTKFSNVKEESRSDQFSFEKNKNKNTIRDAIDEEEEEEEEDDNHERYQSNYSFDDPTNDIHFTIPQSFSMTSCNSSSTNGFSIKSSKSIGNSIAEFEIEESISFTVNELHKINSMLGDAESSCHSSQASDERDVLFYAKQTKHEIAILANAIERKVKAEQSTAPSISASFSQESSPGDDDDERQIKRVGSPLKQDRMAKSPAMDRLIEDVNELCNQIENRIDNIVSDTQS